MTGSKEVFMEQRELEMRQEELSASYRREYEERLAAQRRYLEESELIAHQAATQAQEAGSS